MKFGGIAERDERQAAFVLQNNSTAEKGVRGGGRSQGKQRSAAPPASQARQGGPRGNAPPRYVNRELELELIQSHMAQKPVLRGEVGVRVRVIRACGLRRERRYERARWCKTPG